MCEIKMTEYTFEINKTIAVKVHGSDTDENYEKAIKEAIRQIKHDVDEDWLAVVIAEECTDYKNEYEEAI